MITRDRIVNVGGVRTYLHLSIELGFVGDEEKWRVNMYYRHNSRHEWRRCEKGDELYEELSGFVTRDWIDRVRRDVMAACVNVNVFEY